MSEPIDDYSYLDAAAAEAAKRRGKSRLAQAVEAARGGPAPNVGQNRIPTALNSADDAPATSDPTFDLRRKQANLCEAVMVRVFDLEAQAKELTEIAKKLRAAVVANT